MSRWPNRVVSAYETWDRFVAECAQEGLVVEPTAMTDVLASGVQPKGYELLYYPHWRAWAGE